jgi:TetR/AcrR family transcriptional regulator, transcriptional repressor for nem operon
LVLIGFKGAWTPKGEETRHRIVAEAAAMFNKNGFEGSSLSELMKATGLEKGGIYRHFSSKEELAAEAFEYAWKAAWDARTQDLDSIPNWGMKSGSPCFKGMMTL